MHAPEAQLVRGQAGHALADPDVVVLDPEVLGAVLLREVEHALAHFGDVPLAGAPHQHRLVVIVREVDERRIAPHAATVARVLSPAEVRRPSGSTPTARGRTSTGQAEARISLRVALPSSVRRNGP